MAKRFKGEDGKVILKETILQKIVGLVSGSADSRNWITAGRRHYNPE